MRDTIRTFAAATVLAALGGCGSAPTNDLQHLADEVCRQVTSAGVTGDEVAAILHDASRHGPVMDMIEAQCGEAIADAFNDRRGEFGPAPVADP